ncbi:hypothetical protein PSMK_13850 [Phycisphaera mikurensis NBRC 102666]|uniref:Uncharacterized protein n=1 Tax=Phycisphaera mikurensis (strain NBRC 102666 / KCTC 22515 / FYK2301M01) TaxID=1142394 RepID=I0IE56_PHYMF|nr:hypothetical protein PSMK_13850 [Phycisphaera mikurensis NBRC 102666]
MFAAGEPGAVGNEKPRDSGGPARGGRERRNAPPSAAGWNRAADGRDGRGRSAHRPPPREAPARAG